MKYNLRGEPMLPSQAHETISHVVQQGEVQDPHMCQGNPKNTHRKDLWVLVDEKQDMSCQCEL